MNIDQEFKTIKEIVKKVLERDSRARNSDHWLIIEVLREMGFKIYIDYEQLDSIPSFETITRCRRKLQENNVELQPSQEVVEKRQEKRQEISEYFNKGSNKVEVFSRYRKPRQVTEVFVR